MSPDTEARRALRAATPGAPRSGAVTWWVYRSPLRCPPKWIESERVIAVTERTYLDACKAAARAARKEI